jgi:pimeloyl-ACP methyl ester carboxylesterase
MPHLHVDGADLYYEAEGEGPGLVFAHGLGGAHMSWWQQVPAFRDRFNCITFSHRGFYPSTGGADLERFADDLEALIDHLGLAEVGLVAQSMGGWTCVEYAVRRPDRVRAIVMAETTGTLRTGRSFTDANARAQDLFRRGIHPAAGERMAREQPALHQLYRLIDGLSSGVDKHEMITRLGAARTRDPADFGSLGIPVLWLFGGESYIGAEVAEWVERTFPEQQVERVQEAGHSIYFERPDVFNRLVAKFLESAASPAGL